MSFELSVKMTFIYTHSKQVRKVHLKLEQIYFIPTRYMYSIFTWRIILYRNCVDIVMVSLFALSTVDREFDLKLKMIQIDICCFSAKHAILRSKSEVGLVRNQDNVPEWSGMYTRGLFFRWTSAINIQLCMMI